jgi:hypothetical protein
MVVSENLPVLIILDDSDDEDDRTEGENASLREI